MPQYLTLEDIRLARDPQRLLTLLRKLGYRVEPALVPLDPAGLDFPPSAGIRRLFLLADHGRLQVLLFELDEVRMANLRLLARDLLLRAGDYLIVAAPGEPPYERLVFANPRRVGEGTRLAAGIRKLVVEPAAPTRHDLDVLEGMAAHGLGDDAEALYRAQARAFDVERMTTRFYRAYHDLFHRTAGRIRGWNRAHPGLASPEGARAFTQRLLNRLMFLYFLQRKGWLAGDHRQAAALPLDPGRAGDAAPRAGRGGHLPTAGARCGRHFPGDRRAARRAARALAAGQAQRPTAHGAHAGDAL